MNKKQKQLLKNGAYICGNIIAIPFAIASLPILFTSFVIFGIYYAGDTIIKSFYDDDNNYQIIENKED
jgi:hypothetical protein